MDRPDQKDHPGCVCAPPPRPGCVSAPVVGRPAADRPGSGRQVLAGAVTTAALLVGLNALVQALNVISGWWRLTG